MKAVLNSFIVKEGHCPHSLGAQSISRYCNEKGYPVELISTDIENINNGVEKILSSDYSICGLSSNYVTESYVIEMARRIKQEKGSKPLIVVGGPSVTYSSKNSKIRNSEADIFVKGDGEEAFYHILQSPDSILKGEMQIPGISTKQNSNETLGLTDIQQLPSVFPVNFETNHVYWETVRGCSFNCIYCAHPGQNNKFREISIEKITQEAKYLEERKFKAIYITDPILGGSKERSKQILKLLKGLKDSFITAEYRPEYLDEETMDLLEEANIGWLEFGLQTINSNLSYFRKNAPSVTDKLEKLSRRKIKYSLDLIAGIPGDTRESFEQSLKFAIENARPTSLKVFPLRIYEGTELHHMTQNKDFLEYDKGTRIIKKSHTFNEIEFLEWMRLGRTSMHLYRFLGENNWFDKEQKFRNIKFFINCSDEFGNQMPEEYDEIKIKEIWEKSTQNER
jgi:radical SAM superfamily enzyme YgiQ (UPF0313 family)